MNTPATIGKFQVLQRIGKGAMGEVYLCKDPALGREVAVKTILASSAFGEEARARFEREARATAALNHPNIVTIFEFGEDSGIHYLAMEYVQGEDLEALIRKNAWSKADLLEVLAQICDGLAFAHEHGVIHRDVKPSNVLVHRRGKRIQAKLMDFGVALINQSNLTQDGVWMGTVSYMAPEYLDTGKASPSSDLFAVGVMLYEILTGGRKPFSGETVTTVLNAILRHPPEAFRPEEAQDSGAALLNVARKALAKSPEDRYANAEELGMAIREALEPSRMPSPSGVDPIRHGKARHTPDGVIVGKGGQGNCMSLRVALRQAPPGSIITILPGIYRESLILESDVTLKGEGDPESIILESPIGSCLTLKSSSAKVSGITFQKSPEESERPSPAIQVQEGRLILERCILNTKNGPGILAQGKGAHVLIQQGRFSGGSTAVQAAQGAMIALEDCSGQGQKQAGVLVSPGGSASLLRSHFQDGQGLGILVHAGGQTTAEDCRFENMRSGSVEVESEGHIHLRRCQLLQSRFAGVLALERSQVVLEDCNVSEHEGSGVHAVNQASVQLRQCRIHGNTGYGISVMDQGLVTLEGCEIFQNVLPGVFLHAGSTAQLKNCKLYEGQSLGVVCTSRGRGVLDGCEIYGNAKSGAKVEPGGSLLLVRCVLRDGRDTGLLLFEDAELTLEECAVHRNARGGIMLTKDASDPTLRGKNQIEDDILRTNAQGDLVKMRPQKGR